MGKLCIFNFCRIFHCPQILLVNPWLPMYNMVLVLLCRLSNIFSHCLSAFSKAELRFPILLEDAAIGLFLQLQYHCLPCWKAIQGPPLLLWIILWYFYRIGYKIFKDGKEIKEKLRKFLTVLKMPCLFT
jgi:hypothetical protein